MTIRLGQVAPNFEQDTANGSIRFHSWLGSSWGLLFSYPGNAGTLSRAELVQVSLLKPEWDKRDTKPVALCVDSADSCFWFGHEIEQAYAHNLYFPLMADSDRRVSDLYGISHPDRDWVADARHVFLIDPNKRIQLILIYPPDVGRNFEEVFRVIDGLQVKEAPGCSSISSIGETR